MMQIRHAAIAYDLIAPITLIKINNYTVEKSQYTIAHCKKPKTYLSKCK